MTEEQKNLFRLFCEIDTICKENDLDYYMAGGTLIGVLRHKGFVPWDDDMDIMMPRSSWEKLTKIYKEGGFPKNRVLESPEINRKYHNNLGRYVDTTKTAIHKTQLVNDDYAGAVVDILVMDPVPDSMEAYHKYVKDFMLYSDLINSSIVYGVRDNYKKWEYYRYDWYHFLTKIFGKDKILSKFEKKLFTYPEENCTKYVMRWGGAPFLFERSMYQDGNGRRYAKFEGIDTQIPAKSSDYLTWHYGDEWVYIPEHSARESHDAIFNDNFSYPVMRKELAHFIDIQKLDKSFVKRKKKIMHSDTIRHAYHKNRLYAKTKFWEYITVKKIEENRDKVLAWDKNCCLDELSAFFQDYLNIQLGREIIGREDFAGIDRFNHPFYIQIPDEYLEIVLRLLINTERISKADRLLKVRIQVGDGAVPESIRMIEKDILKFREATCNYDLGNKEKAFQINETLIKKYPKCLSMLRFKARLGLILKKDVNEILHVIEEGLQLKPGDGEFIKYKTDLHTEWDLNFKLLNYYGAFLNTTNGIVIMEIQDIFKEMHVQWLQDESVPFLEQVKRIYITEEIIGISKELFLVLLKKLEGTVNEKSLRFDEAQTILLKYYQKMEPGEELQEAIQKYYKKIGLTEKEAIAYSAYLTGHISAKGDLNYQNTDSEMLQMLYILLCLHEGRSKEAYEKLQSLMAYMKNEYVKELVFSIVEKDVLSAAKSCKNANLRIERMTKKLQYSLKDETADNVKMDIEKADFIIENWICNLKERYPRYQEIMNFLNQYINLPMNFAEAGKREWSLEDLIKLAEWAEVRHEDEEIEERLELEDNPETSDVIEEDTALQGKNVLDSDDRPQNREEMDTKNEDDGSDDAETTSDQIEDSQKVEIKEIELNIYQKKILQLLKEVDTICRKNSIAYSLFGDTAKAVLNNGITPETAASAQVIMTVDGFEKFKKAFEEQKNSQRELEFLGCNGCYPDYSGRYIDTETTLIQLRELKAYTAKGMFIEILILRNGKKNQKLHVRENGIMNVQIRRGTNWKAYVEYLYTKVAFLSGRQRYMKKISDEVVQTYGGNIEHECFVKFISGKIAEYSMDILSDLSDISICGHNFKIASYFEDVAIQKNKSNSIKSVNNNNILINPEVSYIDIQSYLKENNFHKDEYIGYVDKLHKHTLKINKYSKIRENTWFLAKRSGIRAQMYDRYYERMPKIRRLYECGDYISLNREMRAYNKICEKYLKKNLGFAVDKEMFEIQQALLRFFKRDKMADKLVELTPELFMKPVYEKKEV